jgi:hypothetical protein
MRTVHCRAPSLVSSAVGRLHVIAPSRSPLLEEQYADRNASQAEPMMQWNVIQQADLHHATGVRTRLQHHVIPFVVTATSQLPHPIWSRPSLSGGSLGDVSPLFRSTSKLACGQDQLRAHSPVNRVMVRDSRQRAAAAGRSPLGAGDCVRISDDSEQRMPTPTQRCTHLTKCQSNDLETLASTSNRQSGIQHWPLFFVSLLFRCAARGQVRDLQHACATAARVLVDSPSPLDLALALLSYLFRR